MKSNGFGSMEQSIVIHVPREQAPQLESRLDCVALKQEGDDERSYFLDGRREQVMMRMSFLRFLLISTELVIGSIGRSIGTRRSIDVPAFVRPGDVIFSYEAVHLCDQRSMVMHALC